MRFSLLFLILALCGCQTAKDKDLNVEPTAEEVEANTAHIIELKRQGWGGGLHPDYFRNGIR